MNLKATYLFFALMLGLSMNAQPSETLPESEKKITEEPVCREVEVLARYRGGYEVLLKQVEVATKNCKKGKMKGKNKNAEVVAEILVDKTGKAIDVQIIKADSDLCQNDIINSLKKSTQWIPARINNKPVNSYIQIRINLQNSYRNSSMNAGFSMN